MDASRTIIFLRDGRAWVAELKDGRARVWSLVAWLSAHPGRRAMRSLALEPTPPPTPLASAPWAGRGRGGLASALRRLLGGRASHARPEVGAG